MRFIRVAHMLKLAPPASAMLAELPSGYYRVSFDPDNGFYLEETESMTMPTKVYGDVEKRAQRIFNTYMSRAVSTGALFAGEKGGGKTMLARKICIHAVSKGQPVIIADKGSQMHLPGFSQFIQDLDFPFVGLFDEFDKNFDRVQDQSSLLSLMDGLSAQQRLLILTCNDKDKISPYMLDRPGRIYYVFNYDELDPQVIRDFCTDNGVSEAELSAILMHAAIHGNMSFDILKAVVEEMLRYDMTFSEAVRDLNIGMGRDCSGWEVTLELNGKTYPTLCTVRYAVGQDASDYLNRNHLLGGKIALTDSVNAFFEKHADGDGDVRLRFNNDTLNGYDTENRCLVFSLLDDAKILLRRAKPVTVKEVATL